MEATQREAPGRRLARQKSDANHQMACRRVVSGYWILDPRLKTPAQWRRPWMIGPMVCIRPLPNRRFSSGSAALPHAALPNEARVTGPA